MIVKGLNVGRDENSIKGNGSESKLALFCFTAWVNFVWICEEKRMPWASSNVNHSLSRNRDRYLSWFIVLARIVETERSIETLSPGVYISIFMQSKSVPGTTGHLYHLSQSLNEAGYIWELNGLLTHTKLPIGVVPHTINLSIRFNNECRVVFSAADLPNNHVKATHLGYGVGCTIETDSQLSVVII